MAAVTAAPTGETTAAPAATHDQRSLAFALLGTFALRCGSYGAGSIIPIFLGLKSRDDSDVTASLAAFIAVTFYGAELLMAPVFGSLSDRFGRKTFMLLGPIFGGIAIQMLGFSAAIPVLALVRILEGLSTAASAPATLGYISAQTADSERLRGRVMGLYEAATVVGLASGAFIATRLYERFETFSFTLIALIYAVSLGSFAFVRDVRDSATGAARHGANVFARMFNRRIMRFAPAWLSANAVLGVWLNVAPFLAAGAPNPDQVLMGGFAPSQIGGANLVFGVVFTAGAVAWGFVMPRIGRQATLLWGVGGLGLTSVTLYVLNDAVNRSDAVLIGLTLLVILGVFVEAGFTPAALAYLAEIAEEQPEDRGSVMGIYSVLLSVGQLLGTGVAGQFADRLGMNGLIVLTGLLTIIAGFTVVLLGHSERRERRAIRSTPH